MWRLFQIVILLAFMFANVFFGWKIPGLAAGVMGGMLAYYLTGIANAILARRARRRLPL